MCLLMLSGVVGIAVADTLFFYALNLIGVGLISIIDCAYSPAVLLCAWLMLSEELTTIHYVGGALILLGVFIASQHKPPAGCTRARIVGGMLLALLAIAAMAVGIVMAKPILEEMALIWATTIRLAAGTLALALFALLGKGRSRNWTVFRPSVVWKFAVPASVLGTYLALIFWIAGFKYTYATIAAVLNQTSVVFATVLAVIFLREPLGKRKLASFTLAITGVVIVSFSEDLYMVSGWLSLWPAWLLLALLPVVLQYALGPMVRRRERRDAGLCVACGHRLSHLTEGRCPECGTPFEPATLPAVTEHP